MLAVILKILSIFGIILLSLLGILLLICLLILFVPISYRVTGHKNEADMALKIRMGWLFKLVRASYDYPEPGSFKVKALFFTVYDSQKAAFQKSSNKTGENAEQRDITGMEPSEEGVPKEEEQPRRKNATGEENTTDKTHEYGKESGDYEEISTNAGPFKRIFAKFEKLKYTIQILCDRIKEIRENISYYKRLWEREETRQLFQYALMRIGKILKNIRPRRFKCSLVYGAESPDVTGYLYGIYGMISSSLGNCVNVVPDFTQAILEGEVDAAGHITVFQVIWNTIMLLIDKRFRLLKRRLKAHKASLARKKNAAPASSS